MTDRRQDILTAALPIFVDKGYTGTTIADLRKASGATTGSIYHFFAGKPGIAIALWREANATWTREAETARRDDTPEDIVKASVRGLLDWALADRPLFLFFEELRIRAYSDPDLAPITEEIGRMHETAGALYRDWVRQGQVRDMAWSVASALMVGPSYDYLRKCAEGDDHRAATEALVEAAWAAVRREAQAGS